MRYADTLRKTTFAAMTAAALAFGGSQAMASPAQADGGARRCDPEACTRKCAMEGLYGFCDGRGCWCR